MEAGSPAAAATHPADVGFSSPTGADHPCSTAILGAGCRAPALAACAGSGPRRAGSLLAASPGPGPWRTSSPAPLLGSAA